MRKLSGRGRGALPLIAAAVVFAALATAALAFAAGGEKPVTVRAGNLELTFNGGFRPKALPKKTLAPITLSVSGDIATLDGSHPPALKEFFLETDKNGSVFVKGYPVCKSGQLQAQDTQQAEKVCKKALIGTGTTDIQIEFAESAPVPVHSKLLVFNGGQKGGTITFYIHAYITVPVPAAVVTTVKIKKIHRGRYGIESIASIPKIAGGAGSVTSFSLKIGKTYKYRGKKVSVLSARCPDGKLQAHGTAVFSDGTKASAEVTRACTPKG